VHHPSRVGEVLAYARRVERAVGEGSVQAVGVGPWVGEWPDDDRYDPELLRDGDARNVVDRYRYWRL
jgi:hypothetical protein